MNEDIEMKLGSTIYRRLQAVRMTETERQVAIDAMRQANLLVDGFVWIGRKMGQLGELFSSKPTLQH
jgi:hypothetical protein